MTQHDRAQATDEQARTVRDSLSTNIVVDVATRIGYLITRCFIPPFVLAHIGLSAYGLWSAAFIIVSYLGVSTLGVSSVYIKYTAEYAATKDYTRSNQLLSTGLILSVPLCLITFVLLFWFWPFVQQYLRIPPELQSTASEVVLIVVATFLTSIAFSVYRDALTGVQKLATVQLIWAVAYMAETALIFALVGGGRGVRGLAEAFLIRTMIEIGLTAVAAHKALPWLKLGIRSYSHTEMKTLVSFGGPVQVLGLLAIALNSIERMLAAPLIGLQATGLLDIGKKLPSMAASVPSAFASSLIPAASYLQAGKNHAEENEALVKLYLKGARYMNLAAAYVCGFLALMPDPILNVWLGQTYPGAATLMVLFAISTQVHLMTGPGTAILRGIGRPYAEFHYAISNIVALGITMSVSYWAQGQWTTVGIGTAVAAATVLSAIWFLAVANRTLRIPISTYSHRVVLVGVVPYLVAALLALPTTLMVGSTTRWAGAGIIGIVGMLYSAVVGAVVYRFVFEQGERLWFASILKQRIGRLLPESLQAVE